LLLDNIQLGAPVAEGAIAPENDLEELVKIILEYCPDLTIFLRARRAPRQLSLPIVEIKQLDQADLKAYVSDHERGGPNAATPESIAILHRHTDESGIS
jgi:hypothetical protein